MVTKVSFVFEKLSQVYNTKVREIEGAENLVYALWEPWEIKGYRGKSEKIEGIKENQRKSEEIRKYLFIYCVCGWHKMLCNITKVNNS